MTLDLRRWTFCFFLLPLGFLQAQDGCCLSGNCLDGYGKYEWKTGEEYIGNFENGKMDGYGVFYWKNKRKYIGSWKFGKMHGEGLLFYENGEIQKGIWEANNFVRLVRDNFVMKRENILHGEEQIKKIIQDRPLMTKLVQPKDLIWQWVVYKLAGEDVQAPIFWQAESSSNFPIPMGVNAVHAYPTDKTNGMVWVHHSDDAEKMWSGLIYELHNIKNGEGFQKIESDAKNWLCNKEDYIFRYAKLEYKAAQETAKFYKNIWLPYCQSKNIPTNPQLWFYYLPDTFEGWAKSFTDKNSYPWHPYAGYYEQTVKGIVKNY